MRRIYTIWRKIWRRNPHPITVRCCLIGFFTVNPQQIISIRYFSGSFSGMLRGIFRDVNTDISAVWTKRFIYTFFESFTFNRSARCKAVWRQNAFVTGFAAPCPDTGIKPEAGILPMALLFAQGKTLGLSHIDLNARISGRIFCRTR